MPLSDCPVGKSEVIFFFLTNVGGFSPLQVLTRLGRGPGVHKKAIWVSHEEHIQTHDPPIPPEASASVLASSLAPVLLEVLLWLPSVRRCSLCGMINPSLFACLLVLAFYHIKRTQLRQRLCFILCVVLRRLKCRWAHCSRKNPGDLSWWNFVELSNVLFLIHAGLPAKSQSHCAWS